MSRQSPFPFSFHDAPTVHQSRLYICFLHHPQISWKKSIIVSAATLLCFTFRSFYLMKSCFYLLDDLLVLQRRVRHLQYPRYPWNLGKTRRPLLSTDVLVSTLGIPTKRIEDEGTEVRSSDMTRRKYIGRPAARSYMWI
ncbi:hypothetical protein ARMSODRAFT_555835 [Armillaria solidipes]|uniref:Uncharacterized protein n=1 Tax=Armillaria solidipes TaxID=1076256 RepID=A0A2H3B760_9AGAR|nr:hypothetical protein ARMSODRAFT_555835 [Armillaria solidipes]